MEILLRFRWLFIKDNVFIGERGIFGAEVFLCYRWFFVKSNFVIGGVECIANFWLTCWKNRLTAVCLQVAHLEFSNSLEFYYTAHSCEMLLNLSGRGSVQVVEHRVQWVQAGTAAAGCSSWKVQLHLIPTHTMKYMEYSNNKRQINTNFPPLLN